MCPRTPACEGPLIRDIRNGAPVSLEWALLVLSGLETDGAIQSCQEKIAKIFGRFLERSAYPYLPFRKAPPYLHREIAKSLFDYLWNSKPRRFGEYFLLTDVVDAQLDPDVNRPVGTCIGLTSLYSVLGLRAGLELSLLLNSQHLLNRLRVGGQTIDIDQTDPQGFDCTVGNGFREFPLPMLAANVLNSRGLKSETDGRLEAAKADFDKAILVNREYANALNNRGNMKLGVKDIEGAVSDYNEAIRLDPSFCEAYCNRGIAHHILGRLDEARRDYNRSICANSEYGDARRCLRILDEIEQDSLGRGKIDRCS